MSKPPSEVSNLHFRLKSIGRGGGGGVPSNIQHVIVATSAAEPAELDLGNGSAPCSQGRTCWSREFVSRSRDCDVASNFNNVSHCVDCDAMSATRSLLLVAASLTQSSTGR